MKIGRSESSKAAAIAQANGNGHNGNGHEALPSLGDGRIDFVMRSFEATFPLPAEKPIDAADTVVKKAGERN